VEHSRQEKKVQGLEPWEVPALERLLEVPLGDPVLELQLAESWG
jgi:hypothetical protein